MQNISSPNYPLENQFSEIPPSGNVFDRLCDDVVLKIFSYLAPQNLQLAASVDKHRYSFFNGKYPLNLFAEWFKQQSENDLDLNTLDFLQSHLKYLKETEQLERYLEKHLQNQKLTRMFSRSLGGPILSDASLCGLEKVKSRFWLEIWKILRDPMDSEFLEDIENEVIHNYERAKDEYLAGNGEYKDLSAELQQNAKIMATAIFKEELSIKEVSKSAKNSVALFRHLVESGCINIEIFDEAGDLVKKNKKFNLDLLSKGRGFFTDRPCIEMCILIEWKEDLDFVLSLIKKRILFCYAEIFLIFNSKICENAEIVLEMFKVYDSNMLYKHKRLLKSSKLIHNENFIWELAKIDSTVVADILGDRSSLIHNKEFMINFIKAYPSQIESVMSYAPLQSLLDIEFMLTAACLDSIAYEFFDILSKFFNLKSLMDNIEFNQGYNNFLSLKQKNKIFDFIVSSKSFFRDSEQVFVLEKIKENPEKMFPRLVQHIVSKWAEKDPDFILECMPEKNIRPEIREKIFRREGTLLVNNANFILNFAKKGIYRDDCRSFINKILHKNKSKLFLDHKFISEFNRSHLRQHLNANSEI